MDPKKVLKYLNVLINHIKKGKTSYHRDYDRVVELSSLYKKLITGENIESLLKRYNPRETEAQFEQRIRLTQSVTPSITGKIKTPFYKVSRIDNVKNIIVFKDLEADKNDESVKKIESAKSIYFGEESLDQYMQSNFIDDSFSDPNAFLVTEFKKFDSDKEDAKPFPWLVSSEDAINFKYVNNTLEYLVVKKTFKLKTTKCVINALELRIYTKEFIIKIKELEQLTGDSDDFNITGEELSSNKKMKIIINKTKYSVELIDPVLEDNIQACRIGYMRDEVTNKRTFVSPMHPALPRMMKSIKATSEMDLTMTLHVHPQLISYGPRCQGTKKDTCDSGITRNGKECTICKGTGVVTSTSSQESILLPLPRNLEDMLDVDKLVSYKGPSIELLKFMSEFQLMLETQCMQDVFTSESFNRIVSRNTLGEKELDMESVYDTLYPFSNKYSSVYIKQVKMISVFINVSTGIKIIHIFPKDFKLKTSKALIEDRSKAKEANIPSDLLLEIDNDIAVKIHANNPDKLIKYQIRQQHIPYKGKTDSQIQISFNMNLTTLFDKILWSNYDSIFMELENDFLENGINFYELTFDKRFLAIKEKTDEYILKIDGENQSSIMFGDGENIDDIESFDRSQLIKYISDNNLDIEVTDEQDEDSIRLSINSIK